MDLASYKGLKVHVVCLDKFFYIGRCIDADEESITLIDRNGKRVSVVKSSIATIKEVFI